MKRLICILCIAALLLPLCACGKKSAQPINPVNFYYKTVPSNYQAPSITPEIRESSGYEDRLQELIQLYIDGPLSKTYVNPFPSGTKVESIVVNTTTVELQFNSRFATLTDLGLTTASACLTMTILEYTQRHRLIITATDSSGNVIYTGSMTRDHILLSDYD